MLLLTEGCSLVMVFMAYYVVQCDDEYSYSDRYSDDDMLQYRHSHRSMLVYRYCSR